MKTFARRWYKAEDLSSVSDKAAVCISATLANRGTCMAAQRQICKSQRRWKSVAVCLHSTD